MRNRALSHEATSKKHSPCPLQLKAGATVIAGLKVYRSPAVIAVQNSSGPLKNSILPNSFREMPGGTGGSRRRPRVFQRASTLNRFALRVFTSVAIAGLLTGCGDSSQKAKPPATAKAEAEAATLGIPRERAVLVGSVSMTLELIPQGEFMMGTPSSKRAEDEQLHKAVIGRSFYLSKTEVTQAQYSAIIDTNPSQFMGADMPVENITWDQAAEYCKKLSDSLHETVRLPTEAEWEYACRAGTTTEYYSGDDEASLPSVAWYAANCQERPHAAGLLAANAWGLCDMHGDVWEYCQDEHLVPVSDEKAPGRKTIVECRPIRGGSWMDQSTDLRSASHTFVQRNFRNPNIGFRVVVEVKK